jgi:hypothetical protein
MQQIVITHVGGAELSAPKTLALEPEKIVSTKSIGAACEFVYAETLDRRVAPKLYRAANTKAQVDAFIDGTQVDFTVYDQADGSTSTLTVQEKYIETMVTGKLWIYKTQADQAGVAVEFVEGAWLEKKIFVSGVIGDFSDSLVTTTTSTTAAATTTTTAAVTTTTTTGA